MFLHNSAMIWIWKNEKIFYISSLQPFFQDVIIKNIDIPFDIIDYVIKFLYKNIYALPYTLCYIFILRDG